jgi:hypothetical protein
MDYEDIESLLKSGSGELTPGLPGLPNSPPVLRMRVRPGIVFPLEDKVGGDNDVATFLAKFTVDGSGPDEPDEPDEEPSVIELPETPALEVIEPFDVEPELSAVELEVIEPFDSESDVETITGEGEPKSSDEDATLARVNLMIQKFRASLH